MIRLIIIFSFISYSHVIFALSDSSNMVAKQEIKVLLGMSLEELMDVEVKAASKVTEKIGEIPASVVLITRKEIDTYGYTRLEELLEHVSGMYKIDAYNNQGPNYGVRGFWNMQLNRNIIILVNGVQQLSDFDSNYGIESLPPIAAIDRVEVIRGPMSVIYGTGAFFGVINIVTNEMGDDDAHSQVSVGGGSRQTYQTFAKLQQLYDTGRFTLDASTYSTDGLNIPYSDVASRMMTPAVVGESTGGRLENKQKQVNLSANYKNFSLEARYINDDKGLSSLYPTIGQGHLGATELTRIQLGYQEELTEQLSVEAKVGYTHLDTDFYLDTEIFLPGSSGQQIVQSRAYNAELMTVWQPTEYLEMVSGVQYRRATQISLYTSIPVMPNGSQIMELAPDNDIANWGAFSQVSYRLNSQWKLIGGVRAQQNLDYATLTYDSLGTMNVTRPVDSTSISIIPRLAAIYTPNSSHTFKLLYGIAENNASFSQYISNDTGKTFNAEKIQTVELDYLTYLSPYYLLNVNLFRNHLQDLLVRTTSIAQDNSYYSEMSNAGYWDTKGIEVSLQAQPAEAWELELSATYQTTKDRDNPDVAVAYSPHWLGQMKVAYHANSQLQFGLTGYYVAKMDSYFDPTKTNVDGSFGARIGQASEAYTVMSGNLRFSDWFVKGTFIDLRIYNLFDQEIRYPTTLENTWADKGLLGYERSFMLSLGYQF